MKISPNPQACHKFDTKSIKNWDMSRRRGKRVVTSVEKKNYNKNRTKNKAKNDNGNKNKLYTFPTSLFEFCRMPCCPVIPVLDHGPINAFNHNNDHKHVEKLRKIEWQILRI